MPGLTTARDAAIAHLKASLPGKVRVEGFAGELDMQSVASKNLPQGGAVFVAVGEASNTGQGVDLDMHAALGAFAVTRTAGRREAAEADALALGEAVAMLVHGQRFGLAGLGPALVRSLAPVEDDALDKLGVSVWCVLWEQLITFDTHIKE